MGREHVNVNPWSVFAPSGWWNVHSVAVPRESGCGLEVEVGALEALEAPQCAIVLGRVERACRNWGLSTFECVEAGVF